MIANAVVTSLAPPGTPDPTGDVTSPGADVWIGRAPAYLRRVRTRMIAQSTSGGGVSNAELIPVFRDSIIVQRPPQALLAAVPGDDASGWTVTVEDRRSVAPTTRRFRLVMTDHRAVGSVVDSLRFELADEQAP